MDNYYNDLKKCDETIFDFLGAINFHLPDDTGKYMIEWNLDECKYVYGEIHQTADIILQTFLANHCAYEIRTAVGKFDAAFQKKEEDINIDLCVSEFLEVVKCFREIRIVCQMARKIVAR